MGRGIGGVVFALTLIARAAAPAGAAAQNGDGVGAPSTEGDPLPAHDAAPDELDDVAPPAGGDAPAEPAPVGATPETLETATDPPPSRAIDSPIPPPPQTTHGYGGSVDAEGGWEPRIPRQRSLGSRYVDALAGSWAATGILVLGLGITGGGIGTGIGCLIGGGFGCLGGLIIAPGAAGGLGLILGPGVGSARGAGLSAGEGFGVWALGFLTLSVIVGVGAGVGAMVSEATGSFNTFGDTMIGILVASPFAALLPIFLTPLYAVLIYEDRDDSMEAPELVQIAPYAAPTQDGFHAGLAGAF